MRLTKKTDYAMRAALDLALHQAPGERATTQEIARRTGVPPKFLEAILVELRKAGLLESRRGPEGGHELATGAGRISAGDVWRAVDGTSAPGATRPSRRVGQGATRALSELWERADEALRREVDSVTLEELARRALAATQVVDFTI